MIKIRHYDKKDYLTLVELIEELQDYLIKIDPLQKLRRLPEYGKNYINSLLKKIKKYNGIILISETNNVSTGFVAGIIENQKIEDLAGYVPTKSGRILELIVSSNFRNKNVGSLLMQKIEEYFQKQNCNIIRVEVFEPNKIAHNFYQKLKYSDRTTDMIKKIKT